MRVTIINSKNKQLFFSYSLYMLSSIEIKRGYMLTSKIPSYMLSDIKLQHTYAVFYFKDGVVSTFDLQQWYIITEK